MKIFIYLHSLGSSNKGGAERVAANLANEMIKRGHDVFVGYETTQHELSYSLDDKIHLYHCERSDIATCYKRQLSVISPDIFHVFYYNRLVVDLFRVVAGSYTPFTIQECSTPDRIISNNWRINNKLSSQKAAWEREIVASSACRIRLTNEEFKSSFPSYIQPQIRCFPNPVEKNIDVNNVEHGYLNKSIIFINGYKPHKNLKYLLKVFSQLHEQYPDWVISVYGDDPKNSEYQNTLIKFINEHSLSKKVVFHGNSEDILSEFVKSSIHVLCSFEENFSLTTLEAMSCRLPTIGFERCVGVRNLIRNNYSGILIDDNDDDEFMKALKLLMDNEQIRNDFGYNAYTDSKKYNFQIIHDKWESFFKEASSYKYDKGRLLREQMATDPERALHAERMREKFKHKVYGV